jgi:hypothetical protein
MSKHPMLILNLMEAIDVQLSYKTAKVVVFEVFGENGGREFSWVPNKECTSIRTPGNEGSILCLLKLLNMLETSKHKR